MLKQNELLLQRLNNSQRKEQGAGPVSSTVLKSFADLVEQKLMNSLDLPNSGSLWPNEQLPLEDPQVHECVVQTLKRFDWVKAAVAHGKERHLKEVGEGLLTLRSC
jgi:hypothetical protein